MKEHSRTSDRKIAAAPLALTWLPICVIIAVISYYFFFLYQHAINVPLADDIYDVLQVITNVSQAESAKTSLDILYAQHNEHRTFTSRLVYLGVYNISGVINFRTLIFIANLALPLLFGLLLLRVRAHSLRFLLVLPAALIIFQLRAYGVILWSMAAFAYLGVFLYGFCALFSLHQVSPSRFILAAIMATLGTFTLASGQLIWLLGLVSLLQQSLVRRAAPSYYVVFWVVTAICVIGGWRLGLVGPGNLADMLRNFLATPGHHVLYTLTLLGSSFTGNSIAHAALAGTVVICVLLVTTIRVYRSRDVRLELCAWFTVVTVVAMVLGRAPYSSIEYALVSRYSFPSILLLATLWTMLAARIDTQLNWKRSLSLLLPACLLAGVYCISSYTVDAEPLQRHLEHRVKNFNRDKYVVWMHPLNETNEIVARAIVQGVYVPPARPMAEPDIVENE